jgi:hypothetical protein
MRATKTRAMTKKKRAMTICLTASYEKRNLSLVTFDLGGGQKWCEQEP